MLLLILADHFISAGGVWKKESAQQQQGSNFLCVSTLFADLRIKKRALGADSRMQTMKGSYVPDHMIFT